MSDVYCSVLDVVVKQVFKDLDFLGWYNTGELNYESDIQIHKQVLYVGIFFLALIVYVYVHQVLVIHKICHEVLALYNFI